MTTLRRILLFTLLAFSTHFASLSAQPLKETELKTTIGEVTVFLQGAQITRTGKVEIASGKSALVLKGLSPHIDEKSIQVKATGAFTILSVNHRFNYLNQLSKNARIDSLRNVLNALTRSIGSYQAMLEVIAQKESLMNENKKLGSNNAAASLTQLKQAMDFFEKELSAMKEDELDVLTNISRLESEKLRLESQIGMLQNEQELPTSEIEVRVEANSKATGEFTVAYVVTHAGWQPKYDLRVESVEQPLSMTYKAEVYQNTGVNWDNVKLKFSNGNPNQSGTAPKLETWYLSFYRYWYNTSSLYGSRSQDYRTQLKATGAVERAMAVPEEEVMEMAEPEAKAIATTTVENQTTVEFAVEKPYSIQSNGEKLTVDLSQYDIETIYEYHAVPKLDKDAFLIARIINWDQYNLLEGEANLYFEDGFVGRSILDARALTDTLDISLGRDKNIVIGRTKVDTFSKRRFAGTNTIETRQFEILVRNKKSQAIKLTLFDQVPVSAIGEITVTPTELSGGKHNEQTGEVKWEMNLTAQQQQKLTLGYEVKYPRKEKVVLE
ncbi:MAG: DUF4139 domain-containing protein [Imperialibacter sp.]|uniref:DUF4139 domain-containing protein n=1 Tax=Imperialibacter sp. TaxID=2038411 RepID=UPI0032F06E3B